MATSHRFCEPQWKPGAQKRGLLPRQLAPWLLDEGSLTARLQALSQGEFEVQLLNQGWGIAKPSELFALKCSSRHKILVREVVLKGKGQPWVFARSLVPYTSLTGRLKALKHLDNKPLGALLFQDPNMHRDAIEVAAVHRHHDYVDASVAPAEDVELWGRRSVFYLDQNPLLVSEVFLPDFMANL